MTREWQIEMLWNCPNGHKRQLGRNQKCSECGRPKTEDDEFFMPDDPTQAEEVTDREMLADALAGPNWSCKFCGCHERRNDKECANCGVPQVDGDSEVWEKDQQRRFEEINPPAPRDEVEPTSVPNKPFSRGLGFHLWRPAKYIGGILGAVFVVLFFVWLFTPHDEPVHVSEVHWERIVRLEKNVIARENGWIAPGDGFNVSMDGMRYHHSDHRRVGSHTEHYTERVSCGQNCTPIPRVCTPIARTCRQNCTSNKNGYATCSESCSGGGQSCSGGGQSCSTKYCNEPRTRTVDDYQDFPIYAPYYSWDAWRWIPSRAIPAVGSDTNPTWPTFTLNDKERESGRNEDYKVILSNRKGEKFSQSPKNAEEFSRFPVGSSWTLRVDRLGVVHSVRPR